MRPDITCFNTVMNAFALSLLPREAERVFREVIKRYCKSKSWTRDMFAPDLISYSTLMSGYLRTSEPQEAERLLRELKTREGLITPSFLFTWSLRLMDGYLQVSRPIDAERLLHMLESLGEKGKEENEEGQQQDQSQQEVLTLKAYNDILSSYASLALSRKAESLLRHMSTLAARSPSSSITPSLLSYHAVMVAHSNANLPLDCERVLRLLIQSESDVRPSGVSYNTVLEAYSQSRRVEDVNRILEEMLVGGYVE
jgi:pentatricopeptide repeat protein